MEWRTAAVVFGQTLTFVAGAIFLAFDIESVRQFEAGGEALRWQWLALVAFAAFAGFTTFEQIRLRVVLNYRERQERLIKRLNQFATERNALEEAKSAIGVVVLGGPETAAERKRWEEREEWSDRVSEWAQRTRAELVRSCPEFAADWDAADDDRRRDLILEIIREVRGRL